MAGRPAVPGQLQTAGRSASHNTPNPSSPQAHVAAIEQQGPVGNRQLPSHYSEIVLQHPHAIGDTSCTAPEG
jgi:hypothetical protein